MVEEQMKEREAEKTREEKQLWPGTMKSLDAKMTLFQSAQRAMRGLKALLVEGKKTGKYLISDEVRDAYLKSVERNIGMIRASISKVKERFFHEAAKGHSRPDKFYESGEIAEIDAKLIRLEIEEKILEKRGRLIQREESPKDRELASMCMRILTPLIKKSNVLISGFLPKRVQERFQRFPPVMTMGNPKLFRYLGAFSGSLVGGMHFNGTNHILLPLYLMADESRYKCFQVLVHEQLHYAAELGGGKNIRWRDANSKPILKGNISWFHEGLTEMHNQQILRENLKNCENRYAYKHETRAAFFLQKIVGKGLLKTAYLTGDFTKVREKVDGRLGKGAFANMIDAGSGIKAQVYLIGRLHKSGIDFKGWEDEWEKTRGARYLGPG